MDQPVTDSVEWVELCDDNDKTHYWNRRSNETAGTLLRASRLSGSARRTQRRVVLLAQGLACQYVRPPSFASRVKEPAPAQGGLQILGKGDGIDVPVNMLHKFQQLSEFLVPPVQFFDRV